MQHIVELMANYRQIVDALVARRPLHGAGVKI
jgi:hypothetical protein